MFIILDVIAMSLQTLVILLNHGCLLFNCNYLSET